MPRAPGTPASTSAIRRVGWRFGLGVGLAAIVLFAALAGFMQALERAALSGGIDDDARAGRIRTIAKVQEMVSAMKLITVEVKTTANLTVRDESWRGDVAATVAAPVRLFFGTDLARAEIAWGEQGTATRILRIIAPAPERLATEVLGEAETSDVTVGWMRFRSRAGEYYLGQARRGLYDAARQMTLSEKDAAAVRAETRQRIEQLTRRFLPGAGTEVKVAFADE